MEIANKKSTRFLLSFALIAFISVAVFGVSKTMMGMEKRSDGTMSGCMFSGGTVICTMTLPEHFNHWQGMFMTTVSEKTFASDLLVLLVVVLVVVTIFKRNPFLLFSYYATRWRLYIRNNPNISLFNNLKEIFSQGILNPKIYEFAIV